MKEQWIKPYFRDHSGRFALYLILGALTMLSAAMLMFTSGFLISKSSLQPYNILMVYVPIVGVRTFGISRAVLHYVERLVGHDTVLRILSKMREKLYTILEPQALFISSRYRTGDLLGILADDIEQLQNVYIRTVFPSLVSLIIYGTVVIGIGSFDIVFAGLIAVYIFILIAVLPYISLLLTRSTNVAVKQERNGLYQKLTDAVMGISDWIISGRQGEFLESYEHDEAIVARKERRLKTWARWRNLIGQLVIAAITVSMVYWSSGQVIEGNMSATLIVAFVLTVFPLADVFLPVSEAIERIPQYKESLNRLGRISGPESLEGRIGQVGSVVPVGLEGQVLQGVNNAEAKQKKMEGSVLLELKDVKYAYHEDHMYSVDGVSLQIPQGKRVAIIGRSGAGKSTLLKLMQGAIHPVSGFVTINGKPAESYDDGISNIISVLNQRPHLFDTTIANNIALGRQGCSDEDIAVVSQQAQLDELVKSLPDGLDTPMRETGQRFSGGERQRVALARVLLQDNPVLILDEPTVGLDPRTERELLSTIFRTTQGKSLIWVTHHLVGAECMDEVVFMEHGKIIMRGTHQELMEREARYRNLYHLDCPKY